MRIKNLFTAALLWGAIVPSVQAVIVTASGDAQGNGSIVVDSPNLNEVNVTKVYTSLSDPSVMLLTLEVDAPGLYAITETITNATGAGNDWEGFTWLMSNAEGVFFFDFLDPPGTSPFASSSPDADAATSVATVYGGVLENGQSLAVNLQVLVTGIPEGQATLGFTIVQVPNPVAAPIPLPGAAVLFGLGGLPALLAMARRRA